MIGNHAIARGLVEAGVEVAAAYPGTPSSEILPGIVEFKRLEKKEIHTEWSTNEKCALEVAFGAASMGKKAACFMKQVGLNVAFPSLMKSLEKKINGGFVIVSCDDPGPQSSQTEQDTRMLGILFGIPVFDPASPSEAADVAYYAMNYSFERKTPVILRSTHRVSHAREAVPFFPPGTRQVRLQEGLIRSMQDAGHQESHTSRGQAPKEQGLLRLGIVASGMSYSLAYDVIRDLDVADKISLFKVLRIQDRDKELLDFVGSMERVIVLEETDQVVEALIGDRKKVFGRAGGFVPAAGEVTYDVVKRVVGEILDEMGAEHREIFFDQSIEEALKDVKAQPRPPKLCAGCPHRASFFAMKFAFPDAIFPGDIGCYTLGTGQGAVDTFLDMGSGITFAEGFYDAFAQDGRMVPIIASIGDSTFLHAGLPPLYDAVLKGKKFVLVLMDNGTTAMTGMQPTPQTGITVDGTVTRSVKISDILKGFGISFLRTVDPYDVSALVGHIREAVDYLKAPDAKPAVVIAERECTLLTKGAVKGAVERLDIAQDCIGCTSCVKSINCPALPFDEETKRVRIDEALCTRCGVCLYGCPVQEEGRALKVRYRGGNEL